ncbi:MAG: hypothetical protein PVJ68_06300 [Candidatus Thiodiazotropha sp.]|jgi:hypothetical protein
MVMKISDIQKEIKDSISHRLESKGFFVDKSPTFYNIKDNLIRIVHIDFLSRKNATYFQSNTASFTLNLGVNYNIENKANFYPNEHDSHIKGCIIRTFRQKSPMDLKGFPLLHPERRRRDIWWVYRDASNLNNLLSNAVRVLDRKAIQWLERYSDIDFVIRVLQSKKEIDPWKGGPFGMGKIGCPYRNDLIKELKNIYQIK